MFRSSLQQCERAIEGEDGDIRASALDAQGKKSEYHDDLDRVKRAGGDFLRYL